MIPRVASSAEVNSNYLLQIYNDGRKRNIVKIEYVE